jgi:hypothetical protein
LSLAEQLFASQALQIKIFVTEQLHLKSQISAFVAVMMKRQKSGFM